MPDSRFVPLYMTLLSDTALSRTIRLICFAGARLHLSLLCDSTWITCMLKSVNQEQHSFPWIWNKVTPFLIHRLHYPLFTKKSPHPLSPFMLASKQKSLRDQSLSFPIMPNRYIHCIYCLMICVLLGKKTSPDQYSSTSQDPTEPRIPWYWIGFLIKAFHGFKTYIQTSW